MADYTVDNMKLGPCAVKFNAVSLGGTKGGIKVNIDVKKFQFKCDQAGETVVKEVETGADVVVEMTLLEVTPAMLNATPGFTSGAFSSVVGRDRLALGKVLLLTEVKDTAADTFTFYNAIPDLSGINLSGTAERDVTIKFNCLKKGGTEDDKNDIFAFAAGV